MNQAELDLHRDQEGRPLPEKEEVASSIDEKSHDADLTEKAAMLSAPRTRRRFRVAGLDDVAP